MESARSAAVKLGTKHCRATREKRRCDLKEVRSSDDIDGLRNGTPVRDDSS
jgi:hypothetical protein